MLLCFISGLSSFLMFLACIMDILVWSKAGRIDMNPEENPAPEGSVSLTNPSDTQL